MEKMGKVRKGIRVMRHAGEGGLGEVRRRGKEVCGGHTEINVEKKEW